MEMRQPFKDEYWSAWQRFVLQGTVEEEHLPPLLLQSWRRCASAGLNPYASPKRRKAEEGRTRISQDLLRLVRPALEDLYQFAEEAECVVVFADADAHIAALVGNAQMLTELEHIGLYQGAGWSEEEQGVNALAQALSESFPLTWPGPCTIWQASIPSTAPPRRSTICWAR